LDIAALRSASGVAAVEHLAETPSTMDRARALAVDPRASLPALVVADRQTSGRGRRGAAWWQAPGSLAASLVLDGAALAPAAGAGAPLTPLFALACGVAVAETIRALEPAVAARVRWPNDVVVGPGKLAGILVETAPAGRLVIGVGVNTSGHAGDAPATLRRRVATLPDLTGRSLDRTECLVSLVPRLLDLLARALREPAGVVERYRGLCSLAGTTVTVHREDGRRVTGPCLGVDASGALVVETVAGPFHMLSGSLTDPLDVWRGADAP
jgi:BirA family biotin operon repressor/biotin-[acetyl-CoA-carboxylase] ligase